MRWLAHPNPGTRFRRRTLAAFALGCTVLGAALPALGWWSAEVGFLTLAAGLAVLPLAALAMLPWCVIVVLAWERGERRLRAVLTSWAIVAMSVVLAAGAFVATKWSCLRIALWSIESDAAPIVAAIDRHASNTGSPPESLEALVPSELRALPERLGGCAYSYGVASASGSDDRRTWELTVWTTNAFPNITFYRRPLPDSASRVEDDELETLGDWAYRIESFP